jgi:hypothetical protein
MSFGRRPNHQRMVGAARLRSHLAGAPGGLSGGLYTDSWGTTVQKVRQVAAKQARPPGSLRLVSKTAKGKTYLRWQWRTHRRTDTGWATVDLELGDNLSGLRTRTLVALGDLKAPLLVERFARWCTRQWDCVPAWTGQPAGAAARQPSAWWVELPRSTDGRVKLRFRSLDGSIDWRRHRSVVAKVEQHVGEVWRDLQDNPITELARLLWQADESAQQIEKLNQDLANLKRANRRGDLSKRDYEADERKTYLILDGWEVAQCRSLASYDELLAQVLSAMPRTADKRKDYERRILAAVDQRRHHPKWLQAWHADQWDGDTMTWRE